MVSKATIDAIEREKREPNPRTVIDLVMTLARAGVMPFSEDGRGGPGVRFVPPMEESIDPQLAARILANRAKLHGYVGPMPPWPKAPAGRQPRRRDPPTGRASDR
jgi:hypothetical protein